MPGRVENEIVFVDELSAPLYITFHVVALGNPVSTNLVMPFHVAVIPPLPITVSVEGFAVVLESVRLELLTLQESNDQFLVKGGLAVIVPVPIIGATTPDE